MVEVSGISSLLESNKNLLFTSNQSLSLNTDLLKSLSQLISQVSDSEKPILTSLINQLHNTQSELHSDYQLKVIQQDKLRRELETKNNELESLTKKLEEKEKDFERINSLEAESSIRLENELKIKEIRANIDEKKKSNFELDELYNEHLSNIEARQRKKIEIVEKECEMRYKLRKLEVEREKKNAELEGLKGKMRDMETGRLNQSMSPRSLSILNKMGEGRNSPIKGSSEYNFLQTENSYDKSGIGKLDSELQMPPKTTSRYTLLLLSLISLLLAIIFKLAFF